MTDWAGFWIGSGLALGGFFFALGLESLGRGIARQWEIKDRWNREHDNTWE